MDELVKRIWECASGECFNCSQHTPTTNASICQKELMKQAADVIEELSREAEVNAKRAMKWAFDAEEAEAKLRWIPVAERLPKNGESVLVYRSGGNRISSTMRIDIFPYLGDGVFCLLGVTHWMPLPEPPEEES